MSKYYFTFGFGQPHQNCFHVIEAPDIHEARTLMFQRFENKWSMVYTEGEWYRDGISQEEEYNLTQIK